MSQHFSVIHYMEDKDLIATLSLLKQAEPRQEWVAATRQRLLHSYKEQEQSGAPLYKGRFSDMVVGVGRGLVSLFERPAFVIPALALVVSGGAVWQSSQTSLPGDALYGLRAAVQEAPLYFSGATERPLLQIELAHKRLADLRTVAEQNKVKNLPSAIEAFEASVLAVVENQPEQVLQVGKEIVQLQKEKQEVEQILGTKIGEGQEDELLKATRTLVEYELAYLRSRSLGEEQAELFEKAEALAQEKNYTAALETIWRISNEG